MRTLFISRKRESDIGGLARFYKELSRSFPGSYSISPNNFSDILRLPFFEFSNIHLCDATLLPLGFLLKLLFRKPLSLTAHGLDLSYPNPIYQFILRRLLKFADAVVLDSQKARFLIAPFGRFDGKVFIVNPGISVRQFKMSKVVELPDLSDKIVLLTVGDLVKRKGHLWFIRNVLPRIDRKYVYLIVGDGSEKSKIKNALAELNLVGNVVILGRLSDSELAYIFMKTDIYICPNQKTKDNFEGFGIAAGEAAAMGLPVVAFEVDGLSEVIVNNKNGLLVSSANQFIKVLNSLKKLKNRAMIGRKARSYTRDNYSWGKAARAYSKIFGAVIKSW